MDFGSTLKQLPPKRTRACANGPDLWTLEVDLKTITPILGGAPQTRKIDDIDIIRVPSIRGQLRFWWRALYADSLGDGLAQAERDLWGGVHGEDPTRSTIEISITKVGQKSLPDEKEIVLSDSGAYALWPARATSKGAPTAPRRTPGTQFTLRLRAPDDKRVQVEDALRAWILFGGYGSRARRGLGSVCPVEPKASAKWTLAGHTAPQDRPWLPRTATHQDLSALFHSDPFVGPQRDASDTPTLQGSALLLGEATPQPTAAWTQALNTLKDFRQRAPKSQGDPPERHARRYGRHPTPGPSNFPEADKVRRLSSPPRGSWAHTPQHNKTPVWPRASFGLPIVSRFKSGGSLPEPADYTIKWQDKSGKERERLASPLITKALPLANGEFVPCLLWLYRAFPEKGKAGIQQNNRWVQGSEANLDLLVAPGEEALYAPLARPDRAKIRAPFRMRYAFMLWALNTLDATEIALITPPDPKVKP
jgi:CRISPR-associated protein Cmr1